MWASGHWVRGHSLARLRQAVQNCPRTMLRGVSSLRTKWAKSGLKSVCVAKRKEASVVGSEDRHGKAASVSADIREVDREPACRQAEAERTQAHEGQFSLKGTLSTCGANDVVDGVHGSCWWVP